MTKITASEINTQKHVRYFAQRGGANPANPIRYSGQDSTYINIESVSNPVRGDINRVNVHSPNRIGTYRPVAQTVDAPDFPTATVQFYEKKDVLPAHLVNMRSCKTTFYQVVGDCKDLSDFDNGWSSYIKVLADGTVTTPEEAGGSFDGDEALTDELEFTFSQVYNIGKIGFSERATTEVYSEVKDIVYAGRENCGNCGPNDDGTNLIYAVTDNTVGSPGDTPSVYYTTDGGITWTQLLINGSASTDVPVAIDIVGQYLIVVFDDGSTGGYFWSEINNITGVPSSTWTKVTTGFTTSKQPTDVFVANAREVWFSGKGGYIYKSSANITSGVSVIDAGDATTNDLNRIHALDEVIVAVGNSGNVIYSVNRGETFATTVTYPTGVASNSSVQVLSDYTWWVGDESGGLYYTNDQGNSWTSAGFLPSDITKVNDVVFVTSEVGFCAAQTADPTARIYATMNGGVSWTTSSPRILNLPTFDYVNRMAYPQIENVSLAVNNLAVAGLAGDGADGIILVATATVL